MALGAQGVWTGSVWLGVRESDTSPLVKEKLFAARPKDAVRSRSLSGKPARLLRTGWTDAWERDDCPGTLAMPLQYMACSEAQTRIGLAARKPGAKARELVVMPVGQVVGRMSEEKSSAELIYEFIDEFVESVERLQGMLDAAQRS
jgi:NAD(P)H-dependent flavin oxidoreductase YrpB (nitropropane dioxygenase family)